MYEADPPIAETDLSDFCLKSQCAGVGMEASGSDPLCKQCGKLVHALDERRWEYSHGG